MTTRYNRVLGSVLGGCAVLVALASPALAVSWRQILEGRWVGTGIRWTIDQDAVQVNRDPERPFDWETLRIVAAEGRMIVFDIGHDRFVGLLDAGALTISQAGRPGFVTLVRERR